MSAKKHERDLSTDLRSQRLHLGAALQLLVRQRERDALDEEREEDDGDTVRRRHAHFLKQVVQPRDSPLCGAGQRLDGV